MQLLIQIICHKDEYDEIDIEINIYIQFYICEFIDFHIMKQLTFIHLMGFINF